MSLDLSIFGGGPQQNRGAVTSTGDPLLKCDPIQEYAVKETGSCMLCSSHCNGCTGPMASDCILCHQFKFFNTCVGHCPLGFTPDLDDEGKELTECLMSNSITSLFVIISIVLCWFVIVVCCKWRRYAVQKRSRLHMMPNNLIGVAPMGSLEPSSSRNLNNSRSSQQSLSQHAVYHVNPI